MTPLALRAAQIEEITELLNRFSLTVWHERNPLLAAQLYDAGLRTQSSLREVLDAADNVWTRQDVGPRDEDWMRLRQALDAARGRMR